MKTHEERAIDHFRQRLGALLVVRHALTALTLWAFAWGTAVLALRAGLSVSRESLLWGLLTLPVALVPAVVLALRRLPERSAVRALLDRYSGCGGLLMAGEDVPLGGWERKLPLVDQPRLRWQSSRAWGLLGAAACFVLLCFFLPSSLADLGHGPRLEIDRETARLAEQLDVLKNEKALTPERAEELKRELEQVRRDARGKGPAKTLEALDHLQNTTNKAAREASSSMARQREGLARAEALADLLTRKRSSLGGKGLAEGMAQLALLTRKAGLEDELLRKGLDPRLLDALRKGAGLSDADLEKFARSMAGHNGDLARRAERLFAARLIDREALERCLKGGKCDEAALTAYLEANCKGLCKSLALTNRLGRGGSSRGPGAAKLTFGDESKADGVKFKEEALPPGSLRESELRGIGKALPKVGGAPPASSGALAGARADGGSSAAPVVLPRHRDAVQRYFDRPAPK